VAVSMRLTRVGGRKDPVWRVVVADKRSPRDGRFIETVGRYNAQTEPSTIVLDEDRIRYWLGQGAQPSDTVKKLLRTQGISEHERMPRDLLEYLTKANVDQPAKVKVEEFEEDDGTLVLELSVDEDDYGQIIGRGGRTAAALRTVVKAAGSRQDKRVLVDIVD
jgi:small subunit ribosomal protein S16